MIHPHILLVVPRLNIGGAESYVFTLAQGLLARHYQVTIASWGGLLADELSSIGVRHYRIPIRLNSYLASRMLEYVIKKEQIHLVHANSAAAGLAAAKACRRLSIPWVYTAHGMINNKELQAGLHFADRIICVSEFLLQHLKEHTQASPEKLVTIYNGINLQDFIPKNRRTALREQWGVTENDFVPAIISRIAKANNKGHKDLLEIMSNYQPARNWHLVVVGKGSYLPMLKYHAWRLKLSDRVIFAGHHTDIPAVLEAIDVLAFPSKFETFGLAAAEAMAMAKPVVAYAVGGIPEVIDDTNGFLIAKDDLNAFAHKIDILYHDRQLAQQLGSSGRQKVEQLFDSKQMIDKTTLLYRQVLEEREKVN